MGGKGGKIAARNGNEVARWAAKTPTIRRDAATSSARCESLPLGAGGHDWRSMRLFKVLAR
jgi:hypothetical protein